MVAIIRANHVPTARNEAPHRPFVPPRLYARPRAPKPPVRPSYAVSVRVKINPHVAMQHAMARPVEPPRLELDRIAQAVCWAWNVAFDELRSQNRKLYIARPRQAAFLLAHELTGKSTPQIGRYFRRDHSTVLHGIRVARAVEDADFKALLAAARERLA